MVTRVILIHGTNEQDPKHSEYGVRWWQLGDSEFIDDLRSALGLCEVEDYEIVPFPWSGLNSERARQIATRRLLYLLRRISNNEAEPCFAIAYSHGGNLLLDALRAGYLEGDMFPGLRRYVTVGTPFLVPSNAPTVGGFAFKTFFAFVLFPFVFSILISLLLYAGEKGTAPNDPLNSKIASFITNVFDRGPHYLAIYLLVGVLAIASIHRVEVFIRGVLERNSLKFGIRPILQWRWIGFRHEADEAISGLGQLRNARGMFFPRSLILDGYNKVAGDIALIMLPIVCTGAFVFWSCAFVYRERLCKYLPNELDAKIVCDSFSEVSGADFFILPLLIIISIICFYALYLVIFSVFGLLVRALSFAGSLLGNWLLWENVKRVSLGADGGLRRKAIALDRPYDFKKSVHTFNPQGLLSNFISSYSDDMLVRQLPDIRRIVAYSSSVDSFSSLITTLMSGIKLDGLVHTCYVRVPLCRRFIIVACLDQHYELVRNTPREKLIEFLGIDATDAFFSEYDYLQSSEETGNKLTLSDKFELQMLRWNGAIEAWWWRMERKLSSFFNGR